MVRTVTRVLFALIVLSGISALVGCNTVAGAGQDIQNGSRDVQQHL